MAPLRVLIIGGGVAGPALAFWLAQVPTPIEVTVVERSPELRVAGQQIDLRGQGWTVAKMMGLEPAIRAAHVDEPGVKIVNEQGQTKAVLIANKTGKGKQSLTSEFEIMRGDLVRILYEATKNHTTYLFGLNVESIEQTDDIVHVTFSNGTTTSFDLVIGADGQGSRTRRMILGSDQDQSAFRFLGVYSAYFTVPRQPHDSNFAAVCHYPQGRLLLLRADNPHTIQAYLFFSHKHPQSARLAAALDAPVRDADEQKEVLADIYRDAGWEAPRIIDAMLHAPEAAANFYAQRIGQLRPKRYHAGRVCLLGDAAYCPSPITGFGTSAALIGAYVLAGELARRVPASGNGLVKLDLEDALTAYEEKMRPLMERVQKLFFSPGLLYPMSRLGIRVLHVLTGLWTRLRLDRLLWRLKSDDVSGWRVPDYPELKMGKSLSP